MAAAFEGQIKETLTCKVCYQVLNNPKTLPCMHTYCCDCLRKLVTNEADENTVKCPECRQVHKIPEKGLDDFKVSYMAKTLVEIFDAAETDGAPICKNCKVKRDADVNAVAKCLECSKDVCRSCLDYHDEFIQGHTIVDLTGDKSHDMQRALATAKDRTVHCPKHNTALQIYCVIDKCVICPTCYVISHSGHACIDIHQAAEDSVNQIKELLIHGETLVKHYETAMDDIHRKKEAMETEMDDAVSELTNDMNAALKHIRDTYMQNINIITEKRDTFTKQTIAHLGNIELKKSLIETTMKQMSTFKEYGHNAELASLASEIQLKRKEWKNVPKYINVTFDINGKVKVHKGGLYTDRIVFASVDDGSRRSKNNDTSWRKLLSMLHCVLTGGGAEKLGITVYEDGSAYVHEILALCRDLQGFTIEDVKYAIANDERQSFDWDLYSGDKKPIVWAKAQKKLDTSWRKLLSMLHWVLTEGGAEKLGITVDEDGSAYVHEILALCRDLQGFTIEDVKYAIANDERLSFDWDFYSGDKKPIVWAKAQKKLPKPESQMPFGDFSNSTAANSHHNNITATHQQQKQQQQQQQQQYRIAVQTNNLQKNNSLFDPISPGVQQLLKEEARQEEKSLERPKKIPISIKPQKVRGMSQVNIDKKLPKVLNFLLYKGGATEKSLCVYADGGVPISDILALPQYGDLYTEEDIIRVVKQDEDHSFKVDHNPSTKRLVVRPTEVVVQEKKAQDSPGKSDQSDDYGRNQQQQTELGPETTLLDRTSTDNQSIPLKQNKKRK